MKNLIKLFFLIIIISYNLINHNYIFADQDIVKNYNVTSEIPEGIKFSIELLNYDEIDDIQVKFKIDGRNSFQYEYLKLPKDNNLIEHFFSTLQSSRYVPPASKIEYYFEIFFKDGSTYRTEIKNDILLDSRFEWDLVQGDIVDVYFHGPVSRRAKNVLEACDKSVNDISNLLGVDSNKRISLVMYNNYSEMFDVVVKKSQTQAGSLITEGQAFSTENIVIVDGGARSALGVATHEITHIIVSRATKDSYVGVPLWLNEGLAEYGNIEQDSGYDRYLEWAVDTNRLFPFSSLNRFPGNPNLTLVAYGQSKSFIEFLVKEYPEENMKNLMKEISGRKSIDDSFISSYGKNLNDLESEWKSTLLSIDSNEFLLKQVDEPGINLNENGSCGGGKMSFETMLISLIILTIFVRKIRFYI
ncbi:MAG: peptidase MA family metallohydrolase [Dehalococcoidia bacterium]